MKIDHIGYAVKDMGQAITVLEKLGYQFGTAAIDEMRNVVVAIGLLGAVRVELISPLDGNPSPVDSYLKKIGNTPYHICYQVDDIEECIDSLRKENFMLISCPNISKPLGGGVVAFLFSAEIGLIELIQYRVD